MSHLFLADIFWAGGFAVAGILLAAVPIIIHLLNRRRFKIVLWAAMEYLLQAMRKNRRRLRFEQWLLLAVRCLLLALLGVALAKPMGCDSGWAALGAQKVGMHVIVIDNSFPMAYEANRAGAKTHFDQAKILAKQIIERLSDNESVVIITAAGPAKAVVDKPSFDMARAKEAVDRIEQSYSAPDMAGALQLALEAAKENEKQPRKVLYLVSGWAHCAFDEKGPHAEALRQAALDIAKVYRPPVVFNLAKADQWNNAVLDLKASSNLVNNKFPIDLIAELRNFGTGASPQLVWKVGDEVQDGGGPVKLDTNPLTKIRQNTQITEGGPRVLSVSLTDPNENLKADNTRYRVVDVQSELKVLIVEGERGAGGLGSSGAFLELALAPPKEGAAGTSTASRTDSYVGADVISDVELGNKVLGDYRAIILTNVEQISDPEALRLAAFVKEGGTLMTFMGEHVSSDRYNTALLPRRLMPGKLIARKEDQSGSATEKAAGFTFDFNPKGVLHPALREFANLTTSGLDTARIATYFQCELQPDVKAEVVLSFLGPDRKPTKDPAITIHSLGKGRVVFIATTANGDWSGLPAKPAWVALMHELLGNSINAGDSWLNLVVGQNVQVPARLKLTSAPKLTDASKREMAMETAKDADGADVYRTTKPLTKPGIYNLLTGLKSYPVAVNVPAEASDVRTLKEPQFRKAMADIEMVLQADSLPADVLARSESNEYGWMLMLVVLMMVAAECFMAMHFGHYRKAGIVSGPAPLASGGR